MARSTGDLLPGHPTPLIRHSPGIDFLPSMETANGFDWSPGRAQLLQLFEARPAPRTTAAAEHAGAPRRASFHRHSSGDGTLVQRHDPRAGTGPDTSGKTDLG